MEQGQSSSSKKRKTLFSIFSKVDKPKDVGVEKTRAPTVRLPSQVVSPPTISCPANEHISSPDPNLDPYPSIERDPEKRKRMCEHPVNERDRIQCAYLRAGAYQPKLSEYPAKLCGKKMRRFQLHWYDKFRWLEYSPSADKAYCFFFFCFLFLDSNTSPNLSTLATVGFNNWKRVSQGDKCAFLTHVGASPSSYHNACVRNGDVLMRSSHHIDKVINVVSREEVQKARLRVRTIMEALHWLALQGCSFRGHDESLSSSNRGNLIELVCAFAKKNEEIRNVVLENAPKNATYTSPDIQRELLNIMGNRVRDMIRKEVGDAPYCILFDEAQDVSQREQMCVMLRFVDSEGLIREMFFAIKSVSDTTSLNLKNQISDILVRHNLQIQNMRGQGYDGVNNMCGASNGLQPLFRRDYLCAYYVHCFAHRLQLTLVAMAKEVHDIWQIFSHMDFVITIITSSPRRVAKLQNAHRQEIEHLLVSGERTSGIGANQIGILQRHGATCWSSHYESVTSLLNMYVATCKVFECLLYHNLGSRLQAEIDGAFINFTNFEFVFGLHFMCKNFGITDVLCQALQKKNQHILFAMRFVHTMKALLQNLKEDGWEELLQGVTLFCSKNDIDIPDLSSSYRPSNNQVRRSSGREYPTVDHHYHFDVFNKAIDCLLVELNTRFSDTSVELLSISATLDPRNSFSIDDICKLAKEFYPLENGIATFSK